MEQSTRTQPPGPRPRPPVGGRAGEATVPGPAAPLDTVTARPPRPRTPWTDRGVPRPRTRPRLRMPLNRPSERPRTRRPARLTAVGTGVLTLTGTLVTGLVDHLLFGGLGLLFGLGYVVVCFQAAARVRWADLPAAPVSGPIAFAVAVLLFAPVNAPGVTGQLLALVSGLALRAGWLFGGTGLASLIVAARFVALHRIRRGR